MSPYNLENELSFVIDEDSANSALEREVAKLNLAVAKKDLKIEELEKKNNVFRKRLAKYFKQRHFTIEDYVKENDELDDQLSKTEEERDELKSINQKLTKDLSQLEAKIKKELHQSMKMKYESDKFFMEQEFNDKISTLETKITELESNITELEAEIELTGTIKDDLDLELEKSNANLHNLQQKFDDLQSSYSILAEKNQDLEVQIQSVENVKAELDTVMKSKNEQESNLQAKIDELNVDIDDLLKEKSDLIDQQNEMCKIVIEKQQKIMTVMAQLFPSFTFPDL